MPLQKYYHGGVEWEREAECATKAVAGKYVEWSIRYRYFKDGAFRIKKATAITSVIDGPMTACSMEEGPRWGDYVPHPAMAGSSDDGEGPQVRA